MSNTLIHVVERCPVCDGGNFKKLRTPGHPIGGAVFAPVLPQLGVCRCSCGLDFTNPRPSSQLLRAFYASDAYECHQPNDSTEADRKARWLLDLIAEQVPYSPERRFLDFGCGGGFLLRHALTMGWCAVGFDVGEQAIQNCRKNQLPVTNSMADLPRGSFDVIVLGHVFEHIEDPGALLESVKNLLSPRGRLLIEVPNVHSLRARLSLPVFSRYIGFDERYRAFPIHLWYFSSASLAQLLRRHGLEPVKATTSGIGLEELLMKSESSQDRVSADGGRTLDNSRASRQLALQPIKHVLKSGFFRMGFGENLVTVSRQDRER
jgi:SAM-dependent methyltransferase